MALAYVALGSNLQDPRTQISRACEELAQVEQTQVVVRSRLYSSRAIGPEQPDYLNAVVLLETQLEPLALLDHLQRIEDQHQRKRVLRWGPRTLDLDLLLYGNQVINQERLQVPHPELRNRNFVLYPLADITPDLYLPDGTRLTELLELCSREGLTPIDNT